MITGSAAPALRSFPLFYFRLRAFSIQRAQLSRSLEKPRKVIVIPKSKDQREIRIRTVDDTQVVVKIKIVHL